MFVSKFECEFNLLINFNEYFCEFTPVSAWILAYFGNVNFKNSGASGAVAPLDHHPSTSLDLLGGLQLPQDPQLDISFHLYIAFMAFAEKPFQKLIGDVCP